VIVADRCARTQAGIDGLVELAEVLQCAVVDLGGRMNFPSRHGLNQSDRARAVIAQADLSSGQFLKLADGLESDDVLRRASPLSDWRAGRTVPLACRMAPSRCAYLLPTSNRSGLRSNCSAYYALC
jgi:acetolactate synthase I/II/III large subunit